jgi:hypothetical protein
MAAGIPLSAGNKVYVATFGNDANPCTTFSQPCATFTGAISKAGPDGDVLALDAGDFEPISISTPITIDGGAHGAFATRNGNSGTVAVSLGQFADGPVILLNISIVIPPPNGNNEEDLGLFAVLNGAEKP